MAPYRWLQEQGVGEQRGRPYLCWDIFFYKGQGMDVQEGKRCMIELVIMERPVSNDLLVAFQGTRVGSYASSGAA
eukprot:scaffold303919_cov22-Tisochrysis_lutea.AAC.2